VHAASKKVVVGDPDAIVLALICHILTREGYDVVAVPDREELLRLIRAGNYDALIVDTSLDGVLEVVKTAPSAARVILTSARSVDGETGVHAFLKKPLEFGELIDTVRDCVAQVE
jgi:DNA-binding response OmpR family regulator